MLGGETNVKAIVNDFVDLALADPRVNYTRGGRYLLSTESIARTKLLALEFLGAAIGGPYTYRGRSLREIHRGMQISDPEFDAVAEDFRLALKQNGVEEPVVTLVMTAVEGIRGQIVEQLVCRENGSSREVEAR
jgi:hemoglobin